MKSTSLYLYVSCLVCVPSGRWVVEACNVRKDYGLCRLRNVRNKWMMALVNGYHDLMLLRSMQALLVP